MNYTKYKALIKLVQDLGLKSTTDWDKLDNNCLLLRHDIDFSLEYALKMAQIEEEMGVKSTYFFMISSFSYNLFSKNNISIVKRINDIGHKISLHFDIESYENVKEGFFKEISIFENFFESPVDIISIHRPGNFLKDNNKELFGYAHTYQDKYFIDIKYISDSAGKDPRQQVKQFLKEDSSKKALHLLIHPIWWINSEITVSGTINKFIEERKLFLIEEIKKSVRTYN